MTKVLCIISVLLLSMPLANAQDKQTSSEEQLWLGYFNQTRLSNKFGFWFDGHLRTKENMFSNFSTGIARLGLTWYINDATKFTLGYAYVNHFPSDNHKNISQPEHRPWQQLQWHTKYPRARTMQWFRLEERYRRKILNDDKLADGYAFNFKVRYNFFWQYPLSKNAFAPNTFSFILNDEVHINFGKEIVNNYFDQNRFFTGFGYHTNAHDQVQLGYMNLFQQLPAGNRYRSLHVLRLFYFHNLDLRSKN